MKCRKLPTTRLVADRVRAAKNLNYAEIYSPIDGVVISREVEGGTNSRPT